MANPFSAIKAFTEGGDLPIINSWLLYHIKISKKNKANPVTYLSQVWPE